MADRACLLDSNVLLRLGRSADPDRHAIAEALIILRNTGWSICYTTQTLGEFWNVATRPVDRNGFGLSVEQTDVLAREIEQSLKLLEDGGGPHAMWRELIVRHSVRGVQVHDARIAASMYVHGVTHLITFNGRDFTRFGRIVALHPNEVRAILDEPDIANISPA